MASDSLSQSERLIRLEEKMDNIISCIADIKKMLMGNGKPGFFTDVKKKFDDTDKELVIIKLKMAENKGVGKTLIAIFGSGMFASIITALLIKFTIPMF